MYIIVADLNYLPHGECKQYLDTQFGPFTTHEIAEQALTELVKRPEVTKATIKVCFGISPVETKEKTEPLVPEVYGGLP